MVADAARAALLIDQPGQLGARVAGDPGEIPPDQALPGPRQPEVMAEPDQRPLNERVRRLRFMLTSRWKPAPRSCSLLIGQRSDWRC